MSDLIFSLNIVMPMAILLAIGYLFKRIGLMNDAFLASGKKLCFYVLLSCSLFKNLYDSTLDVIPVGFITFVVVMILFEALICVFVAKALAEKRNEIGVIIQGGFRSNFAYIGIPLASMFFTDPAMLQRTSSEISLVSIFTIPLFNVLAVVALMAYSDDKDDTDFLKKSLSGILKNPCIISIFCGILVLLFRLIVPSGAFFVRDSLPFIYKVLGYLASMSTPFSFLLVGASLDFSHSVANIRKLSAVVALRDLILPGVVLFIAYLFHAADAVEYAILVSVFASPTAVSSAIMAAEMGGDRRLADEIVVYTTLFSMFSLLIIIYCLKMTGCL
jgi:predicted permease